MVQLPLVSLLQFQLFVTAVRRGSASNTAFMKGNRSAAVTVQRPHQYRWRLTVLSDIEPTVGGNSLAAVSDAVYMSHCAYRDMSISNTGSASVTSEAASLR